MDRDMSRSVGGIALAVLAAVLVLLTDGSVSVPITLLIVGIALIATLRRTRSLR
jgi:hypothetical protein